MGKKLEIGVGRAFACFDGESGPVVYGGSYLDHDHGRIYIATV